jgi:hypothetical protein
LRFLGKTSEGVEQHAMRIRVDKRTVIVLPMNFYEKLTYLAHELDAECLIVDEGLGAAVRRLDPPEDQVAIIIDTIVAQKLTGSVLRAHIEDRRHLAAILSMTHKIAIAAPAKGQR